MRKYNMPNMAFQAIARAITWMIFILYKSIFFTSTRALNIVKLTMETSIYGFSNNIGDDLETLMYAVDLAIGLQFRTSLSCSCIINCDACYELYASLF